MPTYDVRSRFRIEFTSLSPMEREAFMAMVAKFVADLQRGAFRAGLRVCRVQGHPGVFEITWAPDGRATFHYGPEVRVGEPHIVWRRCGGHEIFDDP